MKVSSASTGQKREALPNLWRGPEFLSCSPYQNALSVVVTSLTYLTVGVMFTNPMSNSPTLLESADFIPAESTALTT